ncbi:MAG: pyridoxal phosphate-dependent aminotransferase, partial [Rectinema sp.]|nr:pyridoxal phosphate-dependent aminotransferase [Rectinema sp.]
MRENWLRGGVPLRDLSLSNPTMVGLERPSALFDLVDIRNREYHPDPRGLRTSREALAAHMSRLGRTVEPDRIFFCASTSEAYSWLFKLLCDPEDIVLIPRPGYPLFEHLARMECVEPVPYRLEYAHPSGWYVDFDSLDTFLSSSQGTRARALIVINPNNPTGSYIRLREREEILRLCVRHSLALISDEVFFDFSLDDACEKLSFAGESQALTFVLDGLSKRLG